MREKRNTDWSIKKTHLEQLPKPVINQYIKDRQQQLLVNTVNSWHRQSRNIPVILITVSDQLRTMALVPGAPVRCNARAEEWKLTETSVPTSSQEMYQSIWEADQEHLIKSYSQTVQHIRMPQCGRLQTWKLLEILINFRLMINVNWKTKRRKKKKRKKDTERINFAISFPNKAYFLPLVIRWQSWKCFRTTGCCLREPQKQQRCHGKN